MDEDAVSRTERGRKEMGAPKRVMGTHLPFFIVKLIQKTSTAKWGFKNKDMVCVPMAACNPTIASAQTRACVPIPALLGVPFPSALY